MDIAGKVAVVTGSGSGIGKACALEFSRRRADVVVADVDESAARRTAHEIEHLGGQAMVVYCDVARDDDVAELRDRTLERFGRVDVLMSNVGVIAMGPPTQIPVAEWSRVFDINVLGTVRLTNTFIPLFVEQGAGHLVITSSTAGLFPYAYDRLPYAASKHALVGMSEGLALYLRPLGVGVTCLCPAGVPTNIAAQVRRFGDSSGVLQAPALSTLEAPAVGALVADAIANDRFLVLTAPEAKEFMKRRAADPDTFIDEQITSLSS